MRILAILFIIICSSAIAQPIDDPFIHDGGPNCDWITSSTGKAIATFAFFTLAIASLFKKIKWRYSFLLMFLLFCVFGAAEIVDAISVGKSGNC